MKICLDNFISQTCLKHDWGAASALFSSKYLSQLNTPVQEINQVALHGSDNIVQRQTRIRLGRLCSVHTA